MSINKIDKDSLFKQLQIWTNNVPLIILGSGASVPFQLPSMDELGEHLKVNCKFTNSQSIKQFEKFKDRLELYTDLEKALSINTLKLEVQNEIIRKTWELVNERDIKAYEKLLSSNIEFPLAELLNYIVKTSQKKASIITTNYDRLAEYATSKINGYINTGYLQNYMGAFSDQSTIARYNGSNYNCQVNIWKVHGSLDWFKSSDGEYFNLPLRNEIPVGFTPSIVTPGLSKYSETHRDPFRTIFSQADKEIKNSSGFLCIGYGFNDEHVQPYIIERIKKGRPIIVIAKKLTPNTRKFVIDDNCKEYILMEEANSNTKVYTQSFPNGELIEGNYWNLSNFIKIIK